MNMRALYTIHDKPLQLQEVQHGLWITAGASACPYTPEQAKVEFFRSAELFKWPLRKLKELKTLYPKTSTPQQGH